LKSINTKNNLLKIILLCILVAIDQFTKYLAVLHLQNKNPVVFIKNVFELYYLENNGAAFGILQNARWLFLLLTAVFLIILVIISLRIKPIKKYTPIQVIIIFLGSGALGNCIDRFNQGYVIDFFYFKAINFPIFNVADIYVTLSAIALVILLLFYYKETDLENIFLSKRK
jgi:signal peptidase II